MSEQITDHSDKAIARLAQQFKEDGNLEDLIRGLVDEVQELEGVFIDIRDDRWLHNATGEQLDLLGDVVGETRQARDDDDYRTAIYLRIAINISEGTPEQLISILTALAGAIRVDLAEYYPAVVVLQSAGLVPDGQEFFIAVEMQRAAAAGVKLTIHDFDPADVFGFLDDSEALGFGDTGDSEIGGDFASVVI